jgi:hypothetical protein
MLCCRDKAACQRAVSRTERRPATHASDAGDGDAAVLGEVHVVLVDELGDLLGRDCRGTVSTSAAVLS